MPEHEIDMEALAEGFTELKEALGDLRQLFDGEAQAQAEQQAEFDVEDDLDERIARFTDTDLVYLLHTMSNTVFGQARDGSVPAAGALRVLRCCLTESTVRFVPQAVIERVDRIMEGEAEPDFDSGRFLRELEVDDA